MLPAAEIGIQTFKRDVPYSRPNATRRRRVPSRILLIISTYTLRVGNQQEISSYIIPEQTLIHRVIRFRRELMETDFGETFVLEKIRIYLKRKTLKFLELSSFKIFKIVSLA